MRFVLACGDCSWRLQEDRDPAAIDWALIQAHWRARHGRAPSPVSPSDTPPPDVSESVPEAWLPCPGFEGRYEVSDLGRVRRSGTERAHAPGQHQLRVRASRRGTVHLRSAFGAGSRTIFRPTHALVAEAFLGPSPGPSFRVEHLNGDCQDNRAANLAWVDRPNLDGWHALRTPCESAITRYRLERARQEASP